MKKKIIILGLIGGLFIMSSLSGCKTKDKAEIEKSFEEVLAIYPTENLMDFYEMEGYRDEEFDEEDKGVWSLRSSMSISQTKDSPLKSEGMVLRINRNTHTAKGYYYQDEIDGKNLDEDNEIRYPVTYDEEGFHLVEEVTDAVMRAKILNFQFFVQYGQFKNLNQYKNIRKMYNPEVPMYDLEYQLTNQDPNVKQLREYYEIPTDQAPTLLLKGQGDLAGSSVGYKNIEFTFDKEVDVFFTDSISYQPVREEDNQ